ncbi:hypothetical protein SM0020_03905 [Sinorhizobium meliloti CCNWSX0020]|uniref:Uncharacterized protein n=1 Tax=Sinorhizobium meliloti CCNWSX0020 TaxID=1107881 RepID=H0FUE3_RHIML|nr:hypothetical protein SM0020_03905 [Sinorhizobium meliloti CCNWSX0020]
MLVIFLPPLLLDGAWFIARLRRHVVGIESLAVGAVFFTTAIVAVVTPPHSIASLGCLRALGAIVSHRTPFPPAPCLKG